MVICKVMIHSTFMKPTATMVNALFIGHITAEAFVGDLPKQPHNELEPVQQMAQARITTVTSGSVVPLAERFSAVTSGMTVRVILPTSS